MPPKKNERKTEKLVEARLKEHGYYKPSANIQVELQSSDTPRIQRLLVNASKKGGGIGRPEFIIHGDAFPDFIIIIECKADPLKHASQNLDKYADYALDGALWYASKLSKDFDVLAIAASGQDEATFRLSHHLYLKGADKSLPFTEADEIASFTEYHEAFLNSDIKFRQNYETLLDFSRELNNTLQAKKITEAQRAFLISGILIGLKNLAFRNSYSAHKTGRELASNLVTTITNEFDTIKIPAERKALLTQAFSFISTSPALTTDKSFFVQLIADMDRNINTFRKTHAYYDIVGQFYVQFLRYANNDKGLGIVLTPPHIADLFADLAEVDKDSIVFDNCCGTGGLLISAMSSMMRQAGADQVAQKRIKSKALLGIEFQSNIYALAVSNMILHGDGKTNILQGDCFKDKSKILKDILPTAGILNPPYKNKTRRDDKEELDFVYENLNCLAPGSKCVAIVPITCATAPKGVIADWKRAILAKHTLEAVMSMPISLFHNSKTMVVTCVMVFTAHKKHSKGMKIWFGYWRGDGFVYTKHRGRIDRNASWNSIRTNWLSAYQNREIIPGLSVTREVGPNDEWCAEAYMPLDYTALDQELLKDAAKRYAMGSARIGTMSEEVE